MQQPPSFGENGFACCFNLAVVVNRRIELILFFAAITKPVYSNQQTFEKTSHG
jgi:hypothetical protein